jgi:uncharacterized protein YbjQ (UPF0145 family)
VPDGDGRELPPVARDRFTGVRTSLMTVPSAVGAQAAGFFPVGEVMGCVVQQIAWAGSPFSMADTQMKSYADATRSGYGLALTRLCREAGELGADGVLGIGFTVTTIDPGAEEFVALGTAVRTRTKQRPKQPFTTDLPGEDVGKLMQAGWVPVTVAIGVGARARYDLSMKYQTQLGAGNTEVRAPTELITTIRAEARIEFGKAVGRARADGGIVSDMTLKTWEIGENSVAGITSMLGTAIAQFHSGRAAPTSALTILPLKRT